MPERISPLAWIKTQVQVMAPEADLKPVEQILVAMLRGLFTGGYGDGANTLMDDIHKIPDTDLQALANTDSPLCDTIAWLKQAPYPEASSNAGVAAWNPVCDSTEQEVVRPPSFYGKPPATTNTLRSIFSESSAASNLNNYIMHCAIQSFQSRAQQGYDLAPGKSKEDYYSAFFSGINQYLNLFFTRRGLAGGDAKRALRELQLLIICWGMTFTHTNSETAARIRLNKNTLPTCLRPKVVVTSMGSEETRITNYDLGHDVSFPQELLTLTPVNNLKYTNTLNQNGAKIQQAQNYLNNYPAKGSKTTVVDQIKTHLTHAISSTTISDQFRHTRYAAKALERNKAMLEKHRLYSPLMYLFIAIGLSIGLVAGVVLWVLADHKRKSLKRIDWKPEKKPEATEVVSNTSPLLSGVRDLGDVTVGARLAA